MGLKKGNVTVHRFLALGPIPGERELVAGLKKHVFRPFQDGLEEERFGFCDWRNLKMEPDPDWLQQERYALFGLRLDTRKVPASLLEAEVSFRLQELVREKDLAFIGRDARISLQDEVKADLLRKVLPTPSVVDVAWDLKQGLVWTVGASKKFQSALVGFFMQAFNVELKLMTLPIWAEKVGVPATTVLDLEPLDPSIEQEGTPAINDQAEFLGEEFLLWLWMQGLTAGGVSGADGDLSACFTETNVMLVNERHACRQQSLSKGNPTESLEAFQAITRGMRPSRLKIKVLSGDMEWSGSLKSSLDWSGMKLPPSSAKSPADLIADRLFLLEEGLGHLERRFKVFLNERLADPEGMQARLAAWAKDSLAEVGVEVDTEEEGEEAADEVPWEA